MQTPVSDDNLPFWFSGGLLVLICWAGIAFFSNVAGFRTEVSDASAKKDVFIESNDPIQLGRRIFEVNCLICHQTTGVGSPQYPPLAGSEWVLSRSGHTDQQLILLLLYGLQGPVRVKGIVYNGNMPGWNHLSDQDIAAVLSYIRSDWGNRVAPLTSEEISTVRKDYPFRVEPWRWEELQALPVQ